MIEVKCISGDTDYIEEQLASDLSDGWEIIDMQTDVFEYRGNLRKETTVYLKITVEA